MEFQNLEPFSMLTISLAKFNIRANLRAPSDLYRHIRVETRLCTAIHAHFDGW